SYLYYNPANAKACVNFTPWDFAMYDRYLRVFHGVALPDVSKWKVGTNKIVFNEVWQGPLSKNRPSGTYLIRSVVSGVSAYVHCGQREYLHISLNFLGLTPFYIGPLLKGDCRE